MPCSFLKHFHMHCCILMIALCSIFCLFSPPLIETPVRLGYFSQFIIKNAGLEHFLLSLAVCELVPWEATSGCIWTSEYLILDLRGITCSHTFLPSAASQSHLLVTQGLVRWVARKKKHILAHLKKNHRESGTSSSCTASCLLICYGSESISSAFMQNERIIMNTNLN